MKKSLEKFCNKFIENRDIFKATFPFESSYVFPVCAVNFAQKDMLANAETLRECQTLLKERTSSFSHLRGLSRLPIITAMAISEDPVKKLENISQIYEKLRERFSASQYLPLAAMVISDSKNNEDIAEICARSRKIYDMLRLCHPLITSSEDVVFATLLALSSLSEKDIEIATEKCHKELKETFHSSNAVQSLSHVLALFAGTAREKASETVAMFKELKSKGYRYGTFYELTSLGLLAMQKRDDPDVAEQLIEVEKFLATQKGYKGIFGFAKTIRLMHASLIVSANWTENTDVVRHTAIGSTVSIVIAQQAAMCAAIAASSATTSSST